MLQPIVTDHVGKRSLQIHQHHRLMSTSTRHHRESFPLCLSAFINADKAYEVRDATRLEMGALIILASTFLAWFTILVFLYVRGRGGSLRHLKGPEPSTFWLGSNSFRLL